MPFKQEGAEVVEFVITLPATLKHDKTLEVIDVKAELSAGLLKHANKNPEDLSGPEQVDEMTKQVATSIILNAMRDGKNRREQEMNNEMIEAINLVANKP